jgi:hypothetical protein
MLTKPTSYKEERKENHSRRHKIISWKNPSNTEGKEPHVLGSKITLYREVFINFVVYLKSDKP